MKPLFTVHAGEFLVACEIERLFRNVNIWVPAKDTGIDLLTTNSMNTKPVSLQVKFSRDYASDKGAPQRGTGDFRAGGWWTLKRQKIRDSKADLWVFVLVELVSHSHDFIIIPPTELSKRLDKIHRNSGQTFQSYFCVTRAQKPKCCETRGLKKPQLREIAEGKFEDEVRNFTEYLNIWPASIDALNR